MNIGRMVKRSILSQVRRVSVVWVRREKSCEGGGEGDGDLLSWVRGGVETRRWSHRDFERPRNHIHCVL